jgi:hypothetical protein
MIYRLYTISFYHGYDTNAWALSPTLGLEPGWQGVLWYNEEVMWIIKLGRNIGLSENVMPVFGRHG